MWIFDVIIAGVLTIAVALLAEEVGGWYRKALWAFVAFLVVALATVQIIERATVERKNKQLEADRKSDAEEQRKNLTTLISQMSNLTATISQLQQKPLVTTIIREHAPEPPPSEEAKLQRMSNADFRTYALDWAKKLRDFETVYSKETSSKFMRIPAFGQDQAARDSYMAFFAADTASDYQKHLNDYKNNFWGETVAIYNELTRRYKVAGKPMPEPGQVIPFAAAGGFLIKNTLGGNLNGPHPIGELADYIEILARNLSD
jgi:hypothetical protein